ncbi:MAG: hypothetical protein FWB87_10935 [Defluviitaleaceae bacterium]|nr:hypothetical protein [Defluviitaleaceae bacterium]MCL2261959.1 hypothetical protein [Defluviitaleaceae bacterium]
MKWRKIRKVKILRSVAAAMLKYFCFIVTLLVFLNIVLHEAITRVDMLRMVLSAFAGVIPLLLPVFFEFKWKGVVLHFLLTGALVIGVQMYFTEGGRDVILLSALVFLSIYAVFNLYEYAKARTITKQVNQKLNELHAAENATHVSLNATNKD